MSAPTRQAKSIVAEAAFRARVAGLGGRVVGPYVNNSSPVACVCREGHACGPMPASLQQGQGMCRTCAGKDPATAEQAFRVRIAELGGEVMGPYRGVATAVDCICSAGHSCQPKPNNIQQGTGMCRTCAGKDPVVAEAEFYTRVTRLGGRVVGQYRSVQDRVDCICAAGHGCRPRPAYLQQGGGLCPVCAKSDRAVAEAAFRARVEELGGQVVGEYAGVGVPVECSCIVGHACRPTPGSLRDGKGMCRVCAGKDPASANTEFRVRVTGLGGAIMESEWLGSRTPHRAQCAAGHICWPRPNDLQQGGGMCRKCQGMAWDVFYVVINPALDRIKFGVTSNDGRQRLRNHYRAGYTEVARVLPSLPGADALERHVLTTLRDVGANAVQGREYFSVGALATVLAVIDGWAAVDQYGEVAGPEPLVSDVPTEPYPLPMTLSE